jgi:hypothetical protein
LVYEVRERVCGTPEIDDYDAPVGKAPTPNVYQPQETHQSKDWAQGNKDPLDAQSAGFVILRTMIRFDNVFLF